MQKAASKNRFLIDLSFDQRFLDSESVAQDNSSLHRLVLDRLSYSASPASLFREVANKLIRLAEHAYTLRDTKTLEETSRALMNLPLAKARQVGLFYFALTLKRAGEVEQAQECFELIADSGLSLYRARALQALGALHFDRGQPTEALRFQLDAARTASKKLHHNPLDILMVQLEMSHIQAHAGDHKRALASFESLAPLVQLVAKEYPFFFYAYHNDLAVEFCDLGRLAEAEAACSVALASPFAHAYPEWSETRDEIAAKHKTTSRSVVAIHCAPEPRLSVQAKPQREQESFRLRIACRRANDRDLVPVPLVEAAEFNRNVMLLVWLSRIVLKSRGPPAFSQKSCRPISESNVESAEGSTGREQSQTASHWFCAKLCHLIVFRSIGASGHSLNEQSRGPPLGRRFESEADWLTRLTAATTLRCFKGSTPQQVHNPVLTHAKVNPYTQPVTTPGIRTGRCLYGLPAFRHVFLKKARIQHARVKEAQE